MNILDLLARDALIERLRDAFEDQGMYAPAPEIVEGVYEDAVEPLRQQLAGAVERCAEADRLLRIAYADCRSPEDVPMDVLAWLNPDMPGGQ